MLFKKKRKTVTDIQNIEKDDYNVLFHKKHDLSCIERNIPWEMSYSVVKDNEKVLLQGSYVLETGDDEGWYGESNFHFYIVERNNKKILKLIDIMSLGEELSFGLGKYSYSHIPANEESNVVVFIPEYREKVQSVMKEYELDAGIEKFLKEMSKVDFKDYLLEQFTCKYRFSLVHYDCYDFQNKHVFAADGYCLKKYHPYIELLDYIFTISNKKYLVPSKIKLVDNLEKAYKDMVKRKEDQDELDLMIE